MQRFSLFFTPNMAAVQTISWIHVQGIVLCLAQLLPSFSTADLFIYSDGMNSSSTFCLYNDYTMYGLL